MRHIVGLLASFFGVTVLLSVIAIGLLTRRWNEHEEQLHGEWIIKPEHSDIGGNWEQLLAEFGGLKLSGERVLGREGRSGGEFELRFSELSYSGNVCKLSGAICNVIDDGRLAATFRSNSVIIAPHGKVLEFVGGVVLKSYRHSAVLKSERIRWCWGDGSVIAHGGISFSLGEMLVGCGEVARADTVLGEVELSGKPMLKLRLSKWPLH